MQRRAFVHVNELSALRTYEFVIVIDSYVVHKNVYLGETGTDGAPTADRQIGRKAF